MRERERPKRLYSKDNEAVCVCGTELDDGVVVAAENAPVFFFFVVVVVVVDIQPACHHPSRLVTLKKKGGDLRVVVVKDTPTPLVSKVNSAPVRYSLFLCCVRVSEREEPF